MAYTIKTDGAYISDKAVIVGNVTIGKGSSVFYFSTIRGDNNPITIGEMTNIQEGCILHSDVNHFTTVGNNVTIGHGAVLHGCTISDNVLVGMRSVILDGATVGEFSMIGAGSLVTGNTHIPSGVLALGSPARVIRELRPDEIEHIKNASINYSNEGKALFGDR